MALFGLFGGKKKGYASPWLQLTVVYATARDGLAPEQAFALRGKVTAAGPIDFEYVNPGSFLVYFPGNAEGLLAGSRLADSMRTYAGDNGVPAFGVGVRQGECLAQTSGAGRFVAKPAGAVIAEAMNLAIAEAATHAV
ncbi:MAG: hypothetical protein ABI790_15195 [Betaproteobacteria bacterium]